MKELHDNCERLHREDKRGFDEAVIDADKYERCLGDAAQRLQSALEIGKVKAIGMMEVPSAIDELIAERDALRAALKMARKYAVNRQKEHPIGLREFAMECGVSPTQMSRWTADNVTTKPDIVCSR